MLDSTTPSMTTLPPRGRWPGGLVGMLALGLVAELAVTRAGWEIQGSFNADWRGQRQAATGKDVIQADILCFGDSLVKNGVVPAAFEVRLDRKAYNLAALNAPTPASYSLFKRALDAGARPRAVVLDCNELQLWGSNFRRDVAGWAELVGPLEAWQLAGVEGDFGFFGLYLVHLLLPSARLRVDVRGRLLDRLCNAPPERLRSWSAILERQARRNSGALLFSSAFSKQRPDPCVDGELPQAARPAWYRTGPFAKRTNLVYLDRFLRLAEARQIPVFILVPPIHPGILARREELGIEGEYLWFLRTLHDRYPNVVVVDGRHAGFGHEDFVDASSHLHVEGATDFTYSVAEVIDRDHSSSAGGLRWAAVRRPSERTAWLAVEDLGESMAVVDWQRIIR